MDAGTDDADRAGRVVPHQAHRHVGEHRPSSTAHRHHERLVQRVVIGERPSKIPSTAPRWMLARMGARRPRARACRSRSCQSFLPESPQELAVPVVGKARTAVSRVIALLVICPLPTCRRRGRGPSPAARLPLDHCDSRQAQLVVGVAPLPEGLPGRVADLPPAQSGVLLLVVIGEAAIVLPSRSSDMSRRRCPTFPGPRRAITTCLGLVALHHEIGHAVLRASPDACGVGRATRLVPGSCARALVVGTGVHLLRRQQLAGGRGPRAWPALLLGRTSPPRGWSRPAGLPQARATRTFFSM